MSYVRKMMTLAVIGAKIRRGWCEVDFDLDLAGGAPHSDPS
jgi:hypothetical protein